MISWHYGNHQEIAKVLKHKQKQVTAEAEVALLKTQEEIKKVA